MFPNIGGGFQIPCVSYRGFAAGVLNGLKKFVWFVLLHANPSRFSVNSRGPEHMLTSTILYCIVLNCTLKNTVSILGQSSRKKKKKKSVYSLECQERKTTL